jgi:hypothetical protein
MSDLAPAAPGAPAAAKPAAAGAEGSGKLDDLMLAMDVVDTLRHQDQLVARELNEDQREAQLVERLRLIYSNQGIEVPDSVIQEGVKALKESRFVYTPPRPGLGTTLARVWVKRGTYGAIAGALAGAVLLVIVGREVLVKGPERRAQEAAVNELAVVIPRSLDTARDEVLAEAKVEKAKTLAQQVWADGQAAVKAGDAQAARKAVADLEALRAELRKSYSLLIVSRPGERTGVFRVPPNNPAGRNYYLIVEAVDPNGRPTEVVIRDEELSKTVTASTFGVRVPKSVYDAVGQDKQDDGIVQKNRLGQKQRGALDVDYAVPVQNGFISRW